MKTSPSDNPSNMTLCPKCKITHTIEHDGGQWCPRCGAFAISPDPRHTADIQRTSPFGNSRAGAGARATMPRCAKCGGPGDTGDGIYDDGEWLCGGCIASYIESADNI